MNFLRKLFGEKPSATISKELAQPASVPGSSHSSHSVEQPTGAWSYYEDKTNGVRLPYPKDWNVDQKPEMVFFLPPDRKVAGGEFIIGQTDRNWEFSMTLSTIDKARTALADVDDLILCRTVRDGILAVL